MEVFTWKMSPEDLKKKTMMSSPRVSHDRRHDNELAHLPQDQDVLEGKLSLEPDEQPAETEAKRAAVLRV